MRNLSKMQEMAMCLSAIESFQNGQGVSVFPDVYQRNLLRLISDKLRSFKK